MTCNNIVVNGFILKLWPVENYAHASVLKGKIMQYKNSWNTNYGKNYSFYTVYELKYTRAKNWSQTVTTVSKMW